MSEDKELDKGGTLPLNPLSMMRAEATQDFVSYAQWASPEYQKRWRQILKDQDPTPRTHVAMLPDE